VDGTRHAPPFAAQHTTDAAVAEVLPVDELDEFGEAFKLASTAAIAPTSDDGQGLAR
jgi:hypothetical protein